MSHGATDLPTPACQFCSDPIRRGAQRFMQMDAMFCSDECRRADDANGSAQERVPWNNAWRQPMKREASAMRRSTICLSTLLLDDAEEQEDAPTETEEPLAKRQRPAAMTAAMLDAEIEAELEAELQASLEAELVASQAELEADLEAETLSHS